MGNRSHLKVAQMPAKLTNPEDRAKIDRRFRHENKKREQGLTRVALWVPAGHNATWLALAAASREGLLSAGQILEMLAGRS